MLAVELAALAAAQRLQEMASQVPTAPSQEELLAYGDNLAPLPPPPSPVVPPAFTQPSAPPVAPAEIPEPPASPFAYTIPQAEDVARQTLTDVYGESPDPTVSNYAPGYMPSAADLMRARNEAAALVGTTNYGNLPGGPLPPEQPVPGFAQGGNVYSQIMARWRKLTGKKPMGKEHLVLDEPARLIGEFSGRTLATAGENAPHERERVTQMPGGGLSFQPIRR